MYTHAFKRFDLKSESHKLLCILCSFGLVLVEKAQVLHSSVPISRDTTKLKNKMDPIYLIFSILLLISP